MTSLLLRLKALLLRRTVDRELDDELRYHMDREIERNIANGLSPDRARDAARKAFGNATAVREEAREAWHWSGIETLRQDVDYALRSFRRAPVFAVTVVATIGLALGLLSSAFTFFDAYVLRSMPVRDPHSLYDLSWSSANGRKHRFTWRQFQDLPDRSPAFAEVFAYEYQQARLSGHPALGQRVSANYFTMLGVPAHLGRPLVAADGDAAAPGVIVLSHQAWRTAFGADSSVLGRRVDIDGVPSTIVGVAREGFGGLTTAPYDFWVAMHAPPGARNADEESVRVMADSPPVSTKTVATPRSANGLAPRRETVRAWSERPTSR